MRKKPTNWKTYLSDLFKENVIDPDAEYKVSADGIWVDGIQKVMFSALSTDSTAHSTQYLPDDMNAVGKKQTELEIGKAISKKKRDELEDEKAKNGGNFTNKVEDLLSNIYIEVGKIGDKTAKLDAIEDKLGKLDAIEDKLSAIEKNTSKLDTIASDVESMKKTSESVLVKLNEIDEDVLDCTNTIVALSPQHKKQP